MKRKKHAKTRADFSGLPQTKPWVTYELQKQHNNKYLHPFSEEYLRPSETFTLHLYDLVLKRKKRDAKRTRVRNEWRGRKKRFDLEPACHAMMNLTYVLHGD